MLHPKEIFGFDPLPARPRFTLPANARVAVYLIVNVEAWAFDKPVPRQYFGAPGGASVVPDVPNWSWHEYGMRVGFWRLLDSLNARKVRASAAINGEVIESHYEPVARAIRDAGWNFMGHGYHQKPVHLLEDPAAEIRRTFEVIQGYSGVAPKGWLGPGLHETPETLNQLAAAGFRFTVDWPLDDHPVRMRTSHGDMVSIPYSVEMGDLPLMVAHQHESSAWLDRVTDQFDRLYAEGELQPRVMSMSIHPYIMGAPHRMKYFEQALDHILGHDGVWFTTAEDIFDWYGKRA
ncbi:peptidoglycan/xylan/chitin deacetylase (PgdA/CDA1 family) [Pseudaminobacter salicylatoxidans]|uniref:Chitooligosaccharide deacetylase n=1 Tax=Pseudaminobacter salicylatoxidans TaxID=93369 RepID=A0A316C1P6_PSESE|nr:polysaccharide deacetylase family protein [Pseudaminobacter salicylatoxidans]PWJ82373.1 peptidoglycan/xylan/chitin deacetylase (PgdA/CDA1 family) [Pseudaminobacter salicylatoxidans]